MISDSAALILFAIRSAVKLTQQIRLAYVDSTRRRELVLPLPKFFTDTDDIDAAEFFKTEGLGKKFVDGYERDGQPVAGDTRLAELVKKAEAKTLSPDEKRELVDSHVKYRNVARAEEGGWAWNGDVANGFAHPEEVYSLLTIQQWQRGTDPTPSTLHRIAGTLIEIGIDYALTSPDLFDKNSNKGKALLGFLSALEEIDFKEAALSEIPGRLFVATLETASEHPELLTGDLKIQDFIRVTTKAVSQDVAARLDTIDSDAGLDAIAKRDARTRVQDWTELVFRSTLASGGRLVLSDPAKYLGVRDAGGAALITSVGTSLLDLVLRENGKFADVFSRQGLETVIRAALKAVGEHPEILVKTNNEGIKKLLAGFATDLSQIPGLLSLDVLPEVARMALERTGENLELFWPDLVNHPETNLLLTAAKTTLEILSREPAQGDVWRPRFGRDDLLEVTNAVLDQLVNNPGWLLDRAGQLSGNLRDMLDSVLQVLRQRADNRFSAATGIEILRAALDTVVLRQEFLQKLPNGKPLVAAAIDAILATLFAQNADPAVSWRLVSTEAVTAIVTLSLKALAKAGLDQNAIAKLTATLQALTNSIAAGQPFDLDAFAASLAKNLAT